MASADLPKPDYATSNMRLVGYSDQAGRCDGVQVMVHRGYAYVGHIFSKGFSVIDVRDPSKPKVVKHVAAPPNTWTLHLQAFDDLLLVIHNKDMFAQPELADEKNYYKGSVDHHAKEESSGRNWSAGMAVYDIAKPDDPKQIGFMPVAGTGLHRLWYVGGRWAYASALLDGFSDYILITIDMQDPKKPTLAGKYWLPGMNVAAGEKANWPTKNGRFGLHHAIINDDIAYCSWRDGCLAVVDVKDKANPKLIVHKTWAPPFGGGTHNALPLPDRNLLIVVDETVLDDQEDGFKPIWVFDNQVKSNPISISTFPAPSDKDYLKVGGHFGPHNVHENRPGSFVSSELIFATYQNAGLR
ncbi:MAG: LVIVD repeat-containing protein, partial [Roseiarcus sp.]